LPDVLTIKEAALWVGVTPKTIGRWIKAKILKARRVGRIIWIKRKNLEALFDAE